MARKLLIVSFTFPPAQGIGGRRWAKFAKYLKRLGYDITVLTAEKVTNEESAWNSDVEGINIIPLPYNFPKSVAFPKNDLYNKLLYYANVGILKLRDKGNYFDKSIFWENQVQKKISEIIKKEKTECVIVTSGPFRLSNYVVKLSKVFPGVKFIVDFRDLWTEDVEITSFSALPLNRKRAEIRLEKETVYMADKVISVADTLNDYFSSLTIANKFDVIPNGYDPDDFVGINPPAEDKSGKIKFVFTGTLYINLEYVLKPFFEALARLKKDETELFNRLDFEFIGRFPDEYKKLISEQGINEIFRFTASVGLKDVYSKIAAANFCLLFLNNVYNFALSTKFCEYISQRKKIIVISSPGKAAEYILENKIGYWVNPEFAYQDLKQIIQQTVQHKADIWNSNFNPEVFSIPELTKKLSGIIEEPLKIHSSIDKRNLLLTFDYELFLGKRSGSVENCILKPTERLLQVFEQNNFKGAIFFIDSTFLKVLTESNNSTCKTDLFEIRNQLIKILKKGHYIFPHLHPHWREAAYDEKTNQWKLESSEYYRLHSIPASERDELFSYSIKFIEELIKEAGVNYEVDSYRAGGWCIQPFSELKPHFEKHGLINDFSALRGFVMTGKDISYDFSAIPRNNIYRFTDELEKAEANGKFREIVISTLYINNTRRILNKFLHKYLWYTNQKGYGDGYSAVGGEGNVVAKIQNMDRETIDKAEMVSIELLTYFALNTYKEYLKENDFMHFISHPKMISEHNLKMLDKFLRFANKEFELNTDYKKMIN